MGTWICHLRVAEAVAGRLPGLDLPAFYAGSLAPDSGVPDETWTVFDPPKSATHYLVQGKGEEHIHDLEFHRAYLTHLPGGPFDAPSSFLWGYYFHLLTDILWVDFLWKPTQVLCAGLFTELGKLEAVNRIKEDWYGLDHRYLRGHPHWQPWEIFKTLELSEIPITHIPLNAIRIQFDAIREYYTVEGPQRLLDRPFPYLNQPTMDRVIVDITASILKIFQRLQAQPQLDGAVSAVYLLKDSEHAPYPGPLGDLTEETGR